jgi:hypothetical protein
VTADKLGRNLTGAGTTFTLQGANTAIITGETYTYRIWLKAAEVSWISIDHLNTGANKTYFNLANGTIGTIAAAHTATMTPAAGGYYCTITWTSTTGNTLCTVFFQSADGQGSMTAGTVGDGFYACEAQLNRGITPTIYLPTTTAARYGAAIDYHPTTHAPRGMLVEQAATNLLLNNTALSTQSVTVTAVAHTLSFWGTGTITLSGASTAGPLVGTGAANRVSLTFTPTAGSLTLTVSGTVSNAQLEIGTVASSLIPTYGTTVLRNADNVTFLLSAIPALGSEYSIQCRFSTPIPTANRYAVVVTDGTLNEFHGFVANNTVRWVLNDVGGTPGFGLIIGPTLVANASTGVAVRAKPNACSMSVNGGAVDNSNNATLPTVTEVRFAGTGNNAAATATFYIESLTIVPRAWSDSELVSRGAI